MTVTAEQPPIGRGGGRRWSDRCRGNDRCRDAYNDYAYRGAGKDDAPLDEVGGRGSGGWVMMLYCVR